MHTIPLDTIDLGTRQRAAHDPDTLSALAADIAENGLYHAIQVYDTDDGIARLATGAGRIAALRILHDTGTPVLYAEEPIPEGHAPVIYRRDRGELSRTLIEFGENEYRAPLSWQERDDVLLDIKRLREAEHGPAPNNVEVAKTIKAEPTIKLDMTTETLAKEINRAEILEPFRDDPEVMKAGTKREALKVAHRKSETILRQQLGRMAKPTVHELHIGAFAQVLDNDKHHHRYSCIIADPPYNVGADNFGDQGGITHTYDDAYSSRKTVITELSNAAGYAAAEAAHIYVFMDFDAFPGYAIAFESRGWLVQPWPIIADKGNRGINPRDRVWYRRTYECIMFASRGDKLLTVSNQSVKPMPQPEDKLHGAQKPVDLYVDLMDNSSMPGDTVLDPCCGSGTIFEAATRINRIAVGIELDPAMADLARSRM